MVASYNDITLSLLDLPTTNPPSVLPNIQPFVEKAPANVDAADSIRKLPGPLNAELAVVGELFDKTKVPADNVVAPV